MLWAQQATFEHQEGIWLEGAQQLIVFGTNMQHLSTKKGIWLEVAQQLIVPTLAQPCLT